MEMNPSTNSEVRYIKPISGDPCDTTIGGRRVALNTSQNGRKFEVSCNAGDAGRLEVGSDAISVRIGQCIRRDGKAELWGSVLVESKEQDDGSLVLEVLVYHPEWDEPTRIASILSRPYDGNASEPTLRVDFQHKHL